jgi:hypothetical protein
VVEVDACEDWMANSHGRVVVEERMVLVLP